MAEIQHSALTLTDMHAQYAFAFANVGLMEAGVYVEEDEGKIVRVLTDYYVITDVTAGVGTFFKLGALKETSGPTPLVPGTIADGGLVKRVGATLVSIPTEIAPTSETLTGHTYKGQLVYRRNFSGTMPTSSVVLIASGIVSVIRVDGWASAISSTVRITPMLTASGQGFIQLTVSSGEVALVNGGSTFDASAYDLTLWYTKT